MPCPDVLVFDVHGTPRPKARPRVTSQGTYTPKSAAAWERLVGQSAWLAGARPHPKGVKVRVEVWLCGVAKAGDVDNYLKAILDGLNGVAYEDDRQVQAAAVYRLEGRGPLCRVQLTRLAEDWEGGVVLPEVAG